jgi:outer membrane immunogenic protein
MLGDTRSKNRAPVWLPSYIQSTRALLGCSQFEFLEPSMQRFLIAAVGLVAMVGSASAADLAAAQPYRKVSPTISAAVSAAVYDWSGFYVGLNVGGGWAHRCWDVTYTAEDGPIVPSAADGCHQATGAIVGAQVGYRWQSAAWVFGFEAQGDWAHIRGQNVSLFFPSVPPFVNRSTIGAVGLFTGQVGYSWNEVLWYVKGGGALTRAKYQGIITGDPNLLLDGASVTRWGGAVGTGLEYGFAPNWSFAVEYDHLFMGTANVSTIGIGDLVGQVMRIEKMNQDVDLVTARVNYRFGGPVVAKY